MCFFFWFTHATVEGNNKCWKLNPLQILDQNNNFKSQFWVFDLLRQDSCTFHLFHIAFEFYASYSKSFSKEIIPFSPQMIQYLQLSLFLPYLLAKSTWNNLLLHSFRLTQNTVRPGSFHVWKNLYLTLSYIQLRITLKYVHFIIRKKRWIFLVQSAPWKIPVRVFEKCIQIYFADSLITELENLDFICLQLAIRIGILSRPQKCAEPQLHDPIHTLPPNCWTSSPVYLPYQHSWRIHLLIPHSFQTTAFKP